MKRILFLIFLLVLILPSNIFALEISSQNAILIEVESGKILYKKNAYEQAYPASTTKILTAILALENCELNEKVTASYNAIMSVPYDGTTAAIQVGETWSVEQLVDAMMVCSANEAANMLAEHIGGSIESFASMMNSKAKEIGAKSTNFVNPNGLHDSNHKTTVYDMAMIARYGMLNFPTFRKAASLTSFSLPDTDIYDKGDRYFVNTNKMIIESSSYYYKYATGIKTGYTSSSLNCIVSSAEKDGVELIAVIFGAMGAQNRNNDNIALFEYGFEQLKSENFVSAGAIIDTLEVDDAETDAGNLNVVMGSNVTHTIPNDKLITDYIPTININSLKAPINSGDVVGSIVYDIEGVTYTYDLLAGNSVEKYTNTIATVAITTVKVIGQVIFWAVMSVISIIVAIVFLRAAVITKRQRMRRKRMTLYNSRFR